MDFVSLLLVLLLITALVVFDGGTVLRAQRNGWGFGKNQRARASARPRPSH